MQPGESTSKPSRRHSCYGGPMHCSSAAALTCWREINCDRRTIEARNREVRMSTTLEVERAAAEVAPAVGSNRTQRKNLILAALGSMLEFYEFMVFGFFTVTIARQFFPPAMPDAVKTFQAFAIFTLGFLLRPLSGAILGHLGDRLGRKKLFLFTVCAMAIPTLAIGMLPSYATIGIAAPIFLLILRMAQGVAIAGEFAG